ncbi:unnamed protein product [Clonostachys chloroleuca]|uniref:Uncharacterized protein n=1 Tax=Clonostachys chloroleuca TaxID=1926264 RepID=A0AA35VBD1_9HYPO|nr:unnamed protein product [Clonostachys chloroleuca]
MSEKKLPSDGQKLIQRCNHESKWKPIQQYLLASARQNMARDVPHVFKIFMRIENYFLARTTEMCSWTLVSATELGPESHGKFWTNDRYHAMVGFFATEQSDAMYPRLGAGSSQFCVRMFLREDCEVSTFN